MGEWLGHSLIYLGEMIRVYTWHYKLKTSDILRPGLGDNEKASVRIAGLTNDANLYI